MLEDISVKDDLPIESETSPASTESNKKRVLLGIIIGGVLFVALLIAIIVLVANADPYVPVPVPPKPEIYSVNPFVLTSYHEDSRSAATCFLYNNRTNIEKVTYSNKGSELHKEMHIKNTTENFEPENLMVYFQAIDEHLLNVRYIDPEKERWEVPVFARDKDPYDFTSGRIRANLGIGAAQEGKSFWWDFHGKNIDILPIFSTQFCRLQYFDKYIEFEAKVQTDYIFGMGQRIDSFRLKNDNYSLWNMDASYEKGGDSEEGTFGSHPFFLNRLKNEKDFIGVFMRNSNAMLFSFWHTLNNGTYVNYKMIGGIIDLYIFHEAEPDYILKKYHSFIGRPYLPPVWAMGFQQARRGYTLKDMKEVVENYQKHKIPIDAIWADRDINDQGKTFTVDSTNFQGLKDFVKKLHDPHEGIDMHFVPIVNPGLKAEEGYKYYEKAVKDECLIVSAKNGGKPFQGKTYAGPSVWLDFFLHKGLLVLAEGLHDYYELTNYDGIWISENEPTQMCDGECTSRFTYADLGQDAAPNPFHNESEFEYIPFRPTLYPLEHTTLPMAGYQCCSEQFSKQYFTHNLYGLQITKAAYESLRGHFEGKRFFLASRSTWPGSGHYGSHWIDQNHNTWESLESSIADILNFNMFGIPHVGAPIGGFYGDVDQELFIRWYELAAFSPLMLSYSNSNTKRKEAYAFEGAIDIVKKALLERYALLRFMYTKIFEAFAWGGPVVHPVFFDFPKEEHLYDRDSVDRTFMWGKTLYVIPALLRGQRTTKAYLPNWRWYDLRTLEMVVDYKKEGLGDFFTFDQPLGSITVLIKGGTIVPYQNMATAAKVMNVEDLKKIPVLLIVAPDHMGRAVGSMVSDAEGIRPHPNPMSNSYRHYSFTYMNHIFRINKIAGFDFHHHEEYDYFWELIILDVFNVEHISFACMMDTNFNKKELHFHHTHGSKAIIITDNNMMKMPMQTFESIVWGNDEQHDFCKFEMHIESQEYSEEGRVLLAELRSSEPESYQQKFDLRAALLKDNLLSFQMIMSDPGKVAWIVPDVVFETIRRDIKSTVKIHQSGFRTSAIREPFHFEIGDPHDSRDFVLTSKNFPFVYVRNFMHLKFMVNSRHIFGLGERLHKFELTDGIYSLFNTDQMAEENGLPPGNNIWGSHAFYLIHLHNPRYFAGVFFLNSNPIDVRIRHVGMQTQIDHIFIGGVIDAFFMNQATVDDVIKNYHYLIGKPTPLPYWSFGYHQCRWGYRGIEQLKQVEQRFRDSNLPLDGVWIDKDYMEDERDFTIDKKKWFGLGEFVNEIHTRGLYFVMLIDPAIAIDENYAPYKDGLERDVFIKSSFTSKPLVGVSWPGYSVYVDFVHPSSPIYWEEALMKFKEMVDFDGLWLDMNEPSNFCDGECPDETHYNYYNFPLDFYDDLYYNPTHRPLEKSTISMEALHYGGTVHQPEFNYHNLYGFMESRATDRFFSVRLGKRPFILSSSTFPGSGRYVGHWLGDNHSSWHWMMLSLSGIFNFQMFGIPFIGADVCGFEGNATVPLCSRWMQLAAFYPMMRNHNSMFSNPQEPYTDPKLASVYRKAVHVRYALARYIYSLHMYVVLNGGLYFKPVLFEFPEDDKLYSTLDETFMLGYALKVTPVLEDKVSSLKAYFPNFEWYEFPTWKQVMTYNHSRTYGHNLTLDCSIDTEKVNLHAKGGSIFTYQPQASSSNVVRIEKMMDLPVNLMIALHDESLATGYVYYDNDTSLDMRRGDYKMYTLYYYKGTLQVIHQGSSSWKYTKEDERVAGMYIMGMKKPQKYQQATVYDTSGGVLCRLVGDYKDGILFYVPNKSDESKMRLSAISKIILDI